MTQQNFQARLDSYYDWPCVYTFKFIVQEAQVPEVEALMIGATLRQRHSKGGRWTAVTAELKMADAESVLAMYERAAEIEGLIPL